MGDWFWGKGGLRLCLWMALLLTGCGRIGFDPVLNFEGRDAGDGDDDDDDDERDDGGTGDQPDAGPAFAGSVRLVGSDSCQSTSSVIAVDAGGVALGSALVVQFVIRGDAGAVSVTDSQANSYALLAAPGTSQLRTHVFVANVSTALGPGDTITVSHPSGSASSAMAIELRGVDPTALAVSEGSATDPAISVPFSSAPSGVAYCVIGVRNAAWQVSEPWVEAGVTTTDCGGAPGGSGNGAYWLPASNSGVNACEGLLLAGANQWHAVVATFGE